MDSISSNKNYCNRLQSAAKDDVSSQSHNENSPPEKSQGFSQKKKSITSLKIVRISKSVAGFYPESVVNSLAHHDID